MHTETDTLLTGKVETPKRALALKLGALCGLAALVGAIATPRASGHTAESDGAATASAAGAALLGLAAHLV